MLHGSFCRSWTHLPIASLGTASFSAFLSDCRGFFPLFDLAGLLGSFRSDAHAPIPRSSVFLSLLWAKY